MDKDTKKMKDKMEDAMEEMGEGAKDMGDAIVDGAKALGAKIGKMMKKEK
jgi:uncharacterized protein YbjQ (UPF0145 family)